MPPFRRQPAAVWAAVSAAAVAAEALLLHSYTSTAVYMSTATRASNLPVLKLDKADPFELVRLAVPDEPDLRDRHLVEDNVEVA